jgi:hypothetical protein
MASAECSEETEECTRRVFEAVSNNSLSLLRSAGDRYSKIQLLTSLAECNEEGETPLAIAIKSNYFSVVEEIVAFLKNVLNHNIEENQLKLTFVFNQLLQQIPIKELIDILIFDQRRGDRSWKWLMFVAKVVIKSISLTRKDKIILLELLGAALITQLCQGIFDEKPGALCGLECWREAMTLRYFPTDGGPLLPKLPNVLVPSVSSSFIFGSAVEFATMEELDLLLDDFENYVDDLDMEIPYVKRMVIQAFLMIRRISAQENLGHPHWLYLQSLHDFAYGWEFVDNFTIKPYLFILEELNGFDPNLLPLRSFDVFMDALGLLSDKFVDYLSEPPNSPRGRELNYANLMMITKLITSIQCNHPHFQNFNDIQWRFLSVVCEFVVVLNSISSRITSEEQQQLEKFFCNYIRGFPERTTTVLHVAVDRFSKNHARLQTIQRILQFGADPNAIDEDGETPLHRLAEWTWSGENGDEEESVPLFQVLLEAGAHLDAVGDDGKTVICIVKEKTSWPLWRGNVHPYFESLISTVFPLSCYCARVIGRHGIPFEDRLPPRLKKLVSSHNAKGKQIINHSTFLAK